MSLCVPPVSLMLMTKSQADICVYCGTNAGTDDHVPPKNLFPKPRPSNLVTVRSCDNCNCGAKKDDEYFRDILVFREDVGETEAGAKLWETVKRSLRRPEARRFRSSLAESMFDDFAESPGRVTVGTAAKIEFDADRMKRVLERTVKGLYFKHLGNPMPASDKLVVYFEQHFDMFPDAVSEMLGEIVTYVTMQPRHTIGDDIFEYCYAPVADHPSSSAWAMRFYSSVYFLAINVPGDYAIKTMDALSLGRRSGETG